jgi:hypothetical protein
MRVLGWTDAVTACDCCGKKNIKGTFGVEADDGATLFYGSVCVRKTYGKKTGDAIVFLGTKLHHAKTLPWDRLIDLIDRGQLQPFYLLDANGKHVPSRMIKDAAAVAHWVDGKRWEIVRRHET